MKKLLLAIIVAILMVSMPCLGFPDGVPWGPKDKDKEQKIVQQCPRTKMTEKCLDCHVTPSFALKEIHPEAIYQYPPRISNKMRLIGAAEPLTGYLLVTDVDSEEFALFFHYIAWHKITHVILEIQSPGGSLFEAWRIVGLMKSLEDTGVKVETRVHGFAASAGFMIFVSGTKGFRYASPHAELMWHELMSFSMFKIETPSSSEDASRILRHLQDTANSWLAARSKLSKEELDEKVRKKEFWCNGKEALGLGFVDKLI